MQRWLLNVGFIITSTNPTDYVDPYGALNHPQKIAFHLSLLGSSETL